MPITKNFLKNLVAAGFIEPTDTLSEKETATLCANLMRFSDYARTNTEMLRIDLFAADPVRVERKLQTIKKELYACNALKLEHDCGYILKHLKVRGPENCNVYVEKLISDILSFSIAVQMAQHQAQKSTSGSPIVMPEEQLRKKLFAQLQQALEEFDDEKSFGYAAKLEQVGFVNKLETVKSYITTFEFEKALHALINLKPGPVMDVTGKKRVILAVDDMPPNLAMLKAIIGDKCKFVGVTSGEAALKYLETNIPDVYILDIDMPKMNGFELVNAIRMRRKFAPIIFLTANATTEYVTQAYELGITDFLVKPCNEESVFAKLESIFSAR